MKTGGPAFPKTGYFNDEASSKHDSYDQDGMSLRDYFAAAALTSMLSTPTSVEDETPRIAARLAYQFADAMLAEREKGHTHAS